MPEPLRNHNAELDETVSFNLKDGQCVHLQILRDIDTGVELVQCNLCLVYSFTVVAVI